MLSRRYHGFVQFPAGIAGRIRCNKRSGLNERPTLASFGWQFNPKLPRAACFELLTLKFIAEGSNALIVGKSGTGKSHAAMAVAFQAPLQGLHARYVEAANALAQYALASAQKQVALVKSCSEPALLVLDDLFLSRRIPQCRGRVTAGRGAPTLQAALRCAIIITSNRVVTDWGRYIKDVTMATAGLDRLMHRCSMLEFEDKSYRLKEPASRLAISTEPS